MTTLHGTLTPLRTRLTTKKPSYQLRSPVSLNVVEVITHYDEGLFWWEELAEVAANISIFAVTIVIAVLLSSAFGLIWTALALLFSLIFGFDKFRFRFFERRPETETVRYEGANVPQDLIDRYHRAFEECNAVIREIDALPLSGSTKEAQHESF